MAQTAASRPEISRPEIQAVIAEAAVFMGDRITTSAALRDQHSHGEDTQPPVQPDAVAFVHSGTEVARLLSLCHQHGVPAVAFGAGTSLEGHVTPVRGGISIDMSQMNAIVAVNAADMDCRVQAGVTRQQLNEYLRDQGLFFPVDPGSVCTLGGMAATRASGTAAVRYGTIRENVLGLEVALADGRLIQTGGRVRKSSTGYDLTHLMIGSEGTLGIITEINLRLHPIPEAISAAICQFPTLHDAVHAVLDILAAAIPVARIELLDEVQMGASIAYSHLDHLVPAPTILLEFHGSPAAVAEQAAMAQELAEGHAATLFHWASGADERSQLWRARHDGYWAALALKPGHRGITTDAIVPVSRLADLVLGAQADIAASGFTAPIVGHVGDGNFHTIILVPPNGGPGQTLDDAWQLDRKIVARALALGGSCSGEHGVGIGKREFLEAEHGAETLAVMRQLKAALDPRGIMNPGKLFLN